MASVRVSEVVPASPEAIFAAFTVPDEIQKWHVPDSAFHVCIAEFDARGGGRYRIGMQPPDRDEPYTFYGECREVEAPNRLIYTSDWEPPEDPLGDTLVQIDIQAAGTGSKVTVTHDGLPDEESAGNHTRGWTGTLQSLARHFG